MSKTKAEIIGSTKASIQAKKDELNVAIPAKIVKVRKNRVDIIPDINRGPMLADGTRDYKETTVIYGIPVVNLGCSGFLINIPLKPGCKGLYIHCDYDIDNWLEGNPNPHTARTHDLNDGFFIPAPFQGDDNEVKCLEIKSPNITLKICENGFDILKGGASFMDALSSCCPAVADWKA